MLDDPLKGSLYVAQQDDNPFHSLLAGYMVAKGQGVVIKLAGNFERNPYTGQIRAVFDNNPQQPFSDLDLHFKGGSRGVLATPNTCGTYDISTELTPWSGGDPVTQTSSFTIDKGPDGGACLAGDASQPGSSADLANRPFDPKMNAGVDNPVAGGFTPFSFQLKRPSGHQEILSTAVQPPAGVTAMLKGVVRCHNAAANAGSCPLSSQVGTAVVGAGAGPTPFYIQGADAGKVFLTDPYKGAPLGMLIQVPAKAGPFDLGTVNVRAKVDVDPTTAQINVISDPIPQILKGIPLRVRDIRIDMDRKGFMVAPTDCSPKQVHASVLGANGGVAQLVDSFQVGDCASLGFDPEMKFKADNKDAVAHSDHPALDTTLDMNQPAGAFNPYSADKPRPEANVSKAVVTLPKSMILDQDVLSTICTRAQYAANACPANTQFGTATAWSPLLDKPLTGPVYLRASDNPLPDLVADLDGIIHIDLVGAIDQTGGKTSQLRTTFNMVPDVAVSKFNLKLDGGSHGLIVNTQNICKSADRRTVGVELSGHNGMANPQNPVIDVAACNSKAASLAHKAKRLRHRAHQAKRHGNRARAHKLNRKAKRIERKAERMMA